MAVQKSPAHVIVLLDKDTASEVPERVYGSFNDHVHIFWKREDVPPTARNPNPVGIQ
jgi:hypothetical protein